MQPPSKISPALATNVKFFISPKTRKEAIKVLKV
jgi:hypothetical protein